MRWPRFGLGAGLLLCLAGVTPAQVSGVLTTYGLEAAPQTEFVSRDQVYLGVGSPEEPCRPWDYLSDGLYYFQVTDPTGVSLLSTDPVSERAVTVANGVIASYEGSTHVLGGTTACGSLAVGLMPFKQAAAHTAAYLVWLTPASRFEGDVENVDSVCGDGCFHGFWPEHSRTFVVRVVERRNCDRTFCASGVKFEDRDTDGVRDPDEPGIGGVEVRVFDERTGVFFSTLTFPDGSYRVCGLTTGRSFRVVEVPPFGFVQTGPRARRISRRIVARDLGYFIEFCDRDITNLDFGNRLMQNAIAGLKFEDLNANGQRDPGEPGLAGVTIILTPAAGAARTTVTDGAGNFLFTEVAPVTHVLTEVVPAGFTRTTPASGSITVTLPVGGSSLNNLFGNFRGALTGTVSGVKFNDFNGNGVRDTGEPGLAGVTIVLTPTAGAAQTTVTAADGSFTFPGVAFGSYTLSETVPAGFQQTAPPPPGTISVTLSAAQPTSAGNLFGNQALAGVVSGTKFNDLNGNGLRDAGEPGLAGVTIRLTASGGQVTSVVTDSSGNFSFASVSPGTYVVSEVVPAGFIQTAPPAPGTIPITVTAGAPVTGLLFGNQAAAGTGSISVLKILDFNGDGIRNGDDRPFEGIVFRLVDAGGTIREATSGADGMATFTNLPPGTYVLSEILPENFFQTFPGTPSAPGTYTITLAPGQNATGFVFLNKC